MGQETLERVLSLVCRELGCDDARLEIGGRSPEGPLVLYTELPTGWRLVVTFKEAPSSTDRAVLRLRQMASAFFDLGVEAPRGRADAENQLARRRLDDELCALAGRIRAVAATVIDVRSPVIWGSSEPRIEDLDLDDLFDLSRLTQTAASQNIDLAVLSGLAPEEASAELASRQIEGETRRRLEHWMARLRSKPLRTRRTELLQARSLHAVRAAVKGVEQQGSFRHLVHGQGLAYFARSFASIYVLVLTFDSPFSELHVEGAALHALPVIERHVLALPPIEPPPRGGRVVELPRRP